MVHGRHPRPREFSILFGAGVTLCPREHLARNELSRMMATIVSDLDVYQVNEDKRTGGMRPGPCKCRTRGQYTPNDTRYKQTDDWLLARTAQHWSFRHWPSWQYRR